MIVHFNSVYMCNVQNSSQHILLDLVGLSPSNVTDDADASASVDSPAICQMAG